MAYTNLEGREQLLDGFASAIDQIGGALAAVSSAYEQVDDQTAERLEEGLFGPVQRAYGVAKRAHSDFAKRHGLAPRTFEQPAPPATSARARELIERTAETTEHADFLLASLQDEQALLEVGDVELRSGVAGVREAIAPVPGAARQLLSTLGR